MLFCVNLSSLDGCVAWSAFAYLLNRRTNDMVPPFDVDNFTLICAKCSLFQPYCVQRLTFTKLAVDLLNPSIESEKRKHKLKRLVQSPNSFFMDVKCPGCFNITTVFSHAQTVVICNGCSTVLCQPTGGKARLMEGLYLPPVYKRCGSSTCGERDVVGVVGSTHLEAIPGFNSVNFPANASKTDFRSSSCNCGCEALTIKQLYILCRSRGFIM